MDVHDGTLLIAPGIRLNTQEADDFLARSFEQACAWSRYRQEFYFFNTNAARRMADWYDALTVYGRVQYDNGALRPPDWARGNDSSIG